MFKYNRPYARIVLYDASEYGKGTARLTETDLIWMINLRLGMSDLFFNCRCYNLGVWSHSTGGGSQIRVAASQIRGAGVV